MPKDVSSGTNYKCSVGHFQGVYLPFTDSFHALMFPISPSCELGIDKIALIPVMENPDHKVGLNSTCKQMFIERMAGQMTGQMNRQMEKQRINAM